MIPGTLVYVFVGTTLSSIADAAAGTSDNKSIILILFVVGSVLACGGIVWVSVVAKRLLKEQLEQVENGEDQEKSENEMI